MFIEGVIFSALGISLITKAGLGTSPITSLAFVLTFLPKKLKKLISFRMKIDKRL